MFHGYDMYTYAHYTTSLGNLGGGTFWPIITSSPIPVAKVTEASNSACELADVEALECWPPRPTRAHWKGSDWTGSKSYLYIAVIVCYICTVYKIDSNMHRSIYMFIVYTGYSVCI